MTCVLRALNNIVAVRKTRYSVDAELVQRTYVPLNVYGMVALVHSWLSFKTAVRTTRRRTIRVDCCCCCLSPSSGTTSLSTLQHGADVCRVDRRNYCNDTYPRSTTHSNLTQFYEILYIRNKHAINLILSSSEFIGDLTSTELQYTSRISLSPYF